MLFKIPTCLIYFLVVFTIPLIKNLADQSERVDFFEHFIKPWKLLNQSQRLNIPNAVKFMIQRLFSKINHFPLNLIGVC